jgi:hypothetical protein
MYFLDGEEYGESISRARPEDQVIPGWRDTYVPPSELLDRYGGRMTLTTFKVFDVISEFVFDLLTSQLPYVIKQRLIPYLGDRELAVSMGFREFGTEKSILISYIDDEGDRREIRLG